jgi:predicted metal-dependent peptidase
MGREIRAIQELQETVRKSIASLIIMEPFIGIFSKMTSIYYVDSPQLAWTDGSSIYLGSRIREMHPRDIAHVIAHEAMHIILKHAIRSKQILRRHPELAPEQFFELANYVADAFVHMYLMGTKISPTSYDDLVTPDKVRYALGVSIEGRSFEEVMEEVIKRAEKVEAGRGRRCIGNHGRPEKKELLNEGVDRDEGEDEERIEREINRRIADAYNAAKSAGNVPANFERLVNELLKPRVDWRAIIRRDLSGFFGSKRRYSWKKMSKKQPGLVPGRKSVGCKGDALILVDTSGSIGERELQQFVTEAFAIAKTAGRDVLVIPWDAQAYEPIRIRRDGDARSVKVSLKGGGGTVIYPALRLAENYMRPTTRVIILSDWDIFDLNSQEVRDWLYKYRGQIYAVTTSYTPPNFLQYARISF